MILGLQLFFSFLQCSVFHRVANPAEQRIRPKIEQRQGRVLDFLQPFCIKAKWRKEIFIICTPILTTHHLIHLSA